ncbi:SMP-30/gluconolactonase/LRE family protein [Muriicola sp. Z0-33]|uniref:SMP-30/gluconolactonase/LRE family protein n=1 Tax=Muriicola sp. Z0-33 TaxID=2816957 RepID=UPI0022390FC0|nr:SMP-30/gluconolactonase/LRE family protein [Muriicola sp. Z0-33]MCW5514702.1 SMP-30/gluconolactonase/LRE family protein [Muriicola sp. Z0-33]
MKFLIKILLPAYLIIGAVSCKDPEIKSADFTSEFGFTKGIEGPAVNAQGDLFAVNFESEGTIGRVDQQGNGEVYLTLPEGSIGNGIRFDTEGNMFIADYMGHIVYRVKKNTKNPEIWARDSTMNQPNDLAISPDGTLYLSDPNWSESTGQIWMVSPNRKIELLEANMGTTNGVEVSPDGKNLYVNESVQRMIWKYDILENGKLANKRQFLSFEDFGLDGMRCDIKGNLYITRYDKGTVLIVSPEAEFMNEISLKGKKPSNIAFGGEDGKTCYVTMADRGCFEQFRAPFPGNYYSKVH